MGEFLQVVLDFPTVLFSFLLVVVIGYWLLALTGLVGDDAAGGDPDASGGASGFLAGFGLGGAPISITFSLLVAVAWFVSLAGSVLLDTLGITAGLRVLLAVLLLLLALLAAALVTRLLLAPLRRFFPTGPEASRHAFVGRTCVVRTGRVTTSFGQAEVAAEDGSTAIIQVRQTGADSFGAGSSALIYDYDIASEFFWVVPADVALAPDPAPDLPR